MFFHSSSVTPLRMEERVTFAVVGSGQRGLRVCLHIRQVLARRARCLSPVEAEGCLLLDDSVLQG